MAFAHGSNDAQKTMGIMTLALFSAGVIADVDVPLPVILLAATAISLGTAAGGWRIIKTMGQQVVKLDPVHGFAAETTAATIILGASHFGIPVSTTHVIASAIMGVRLESTGSQAVRWGVAGDIVIAWVLTIPAAGAVGRARVPRPCTRSSISRQQPRAGRSPAKDVADAADRVEERGARRIGLDPAAQPVDVDVDRPRLAGVVVAPDVLEQLVAGEDLARMPDQERQQLERLGLDRDASGRRAGFDDRRGRPGRRPRSTRPVARPRSRLRSVRRSSARTRAMSSRRLNGFVT